jgi:peptidoglycan hydrolase-like protein with peptidoglycan-binding domain
MPESQNGYPANDRSLIASYTIPGTHERIAVRKGSASVVLLDLLGFINSEIEALQQSTLDEWGYAERNIVGAATTLSNHASGTAVDANATKHPLARTGTWSSAQKSKVHARLALYDGVLRWGEDYHHRVDGMHFEIIKPPADVATLADKIRQGALGNGARSYLVGRAPFRASATPDVAHANPFAEPADLVQLGDTGDGVRWVQWAVGVTVDGIFGPITDAAVQSFQRAHHIAVDGIVGPDTKSFLRAITR